MVWQVAKQVNSKVPSLACKPSLAAPGLKLRATSYLLRLFTVLPFFFSFFLGGRGGAEWEGAGSSPAR